MTEMRLINKFIHIGKLEEFLSENKINLRSILWQWRDTASEINDKNIKKFSDLYIIYNEIPDAELKIDGIILYLNAILNGLDNDDLRHKFISLEVIFSRLPRD